MSRRPRRNHSWQSSRRPGGSCRSTRRPDTFGVGKPVRCAPEPDHAMEDPVAGSCRRSCLAPWLPGQAEKPVDMKVLHAKLR